MKENNVYKWYLIGFLLVAGHNIDNIILYGFDPFPILITLPYVVIAIIWKKVPKVAISIILGLFTIIELNHTFTEHLPNLIENGLTRKTFSAELYDIGLIFWVVTVTLLVMEFVSNVKQKRIRKGNSLSK